mmetsp:Transcript_26551/g.88924  ORF Transcript_26551/g.88924 Transcript_26551/m.88924 type:complete len:231 (+) Transcript_26551:423-1115(+)
MPPAPPARAFIICCMYCSMLARASGGIILAISSPSFSSWSMPPSCMSLAIASWPARMPSSKLAPGSRPACFMAACKASVSRPAPPPAPSMSLLRPAMGPVSRISSASWRMVGFCWIFWKRSPMLERSAPSSSLARASMDGSPLTRSCTCWAHLMSSCCVSGLVMAAMASCICFITSGLDAISFIASCRPARPPPACICSIMPRSASASRPPAPEPPMALAEASFRSRSSA